ncbi:RDD family protein [Ureibacillus aquaedulcis]|uniref:RDD family protein n=1 Tax=Ureibacillus aquaedulcis TaxID=3058421 RepID=A0ABT8GQJ8_9BACL|nr:RDD family protein [Ureibacillus sp. BA0131]MDN4493683.1 RDD family protein [Ureibacillus sp. BA0131]
MSENENYDSSVALPQSELVPNLAKKQIQIVEQIEEKTAGFWMRFWAFVVDILIVWALVGIIINPLFHLFGWNLSESHWYSPMTIVSGLFYYAYFVITTKYLQQTVGKMIFGLRVKGKNNGKLDWLTVLFRELVGRFISNKLPIIYLLVAFMPKNNGLNDIIADTRVVQERIFIKSKKEVVLENPQNDDLKPQNSITPTV